MLRKYDAKESGSRQGDLWAVVKRPVKLLMP